MYAVFKVQYRALILNTRVGLSGPLPYGSCLWTFRGSGSFKPVGLSGLEPPTSRLSGVRSNRLSYKPIFRLPGCHPYSLYCVLGFSVFFYTSIYLRAKRNGLCPWWRLTGSNRWPPACKAGALPAELNPHVSNSQCIMHNARWIMNYLLVDAPQDVSFLWYPLLKACDFRLCVTRAFRLF